MNSITTTTTTTHQPCPTCYCNETVLNNEKEIHCFLCNGFPCQACGDLSHSSCSSEDVIDEMDTNVIVTTTCTECGKNLPQYGRRSLTCTGCGLIVEEFLQEEQWNDTQRCSVNLTSYFRISGFVKNGNQKRFVNMMREEYNSRVSRYRLGVRELNQMCTKAGIPKSCLNFIKFNWQKYVDLGVCHKSIKRRGVFLYCIFLGCMEAGVTRTIKEICDLCKLPLNCFRKGEKIMKDVKSKKMENDGDFFYSRFIRLVYNLGLDPFHANEMNNVFNKTKDKLLMYPNDAVTLSIFCWVLQLHYEFNVKQIAKQFKVNLIIFPEVKEIIEQCI